MSEELNLEHLAPVAIELSEQELAEVSGGADFVISGFMFEHDEFLRQKSNDSLVKTSQASLTTFQFVFTGFDSFNDVLDVFTSWFSRK